MRLENKVALVTGAGQGIGRAIAAAFQNEGAVVAGLDLHADSINDCADIALGLDLSHPENSIEAIKATEKHLGPIDILVNAAGICPTRPFLEADLETCKKVFDVNFFAPFVLCQIAGRSMGERGGGAIINIASISAFLGKPDQADYGATKAALVSLTRSIAAALGPKGVRANAIAPGVIDTPLTQQIAGQRAKLKGQTPEETLRPTIESIPLRRIGTPEEVADLAVFLSSEAAAYITGQTFDVCGGLLMR